MRTRPWHPDDLATLHDINEASTPGVGSVSAARLESLLEMSLVSLVAEDTGGIAGFLLCLGEGRPYDSPNYAWVSARYPRFAYVDRVAVAPARRGDGVGGLLYDALERELAGRCPVLLCEVNEQPPNPGSLRFHKRRGFSEAGRQAFAADKAVVYLEKPLG